MYHVDTYFNETIYCNTQLGIRTQQSSTKQERPNQMINSKDFISIIIVGSVWGCTNPFMKKGSEEENNTPSTSTSCTSSTDTCSSGNTNTNTGFLQGILQSLSKFRRPSVLIPYLLNQTGSLFYYKLLATSDLSNAIPACNALAMVFSFLTSHLLGERLDKPFQAIIGSILVTGGVIVCMCSDDGDMNVNVHGEEASQSNLHVLLNNGVGEL